MALIIPKNNADAQTLDATLRIYYEANDWVQNSVLIDKLSSALDNLGIEDEKKEPQSYTKKTQVLAYFGFITWKDVTNSQSPRRITELGKRFYEARLAKDTDTTIAILIESLSTCTFGRNVIGCDSDSDIEAPNVFIKASLMLKGLSNNEFAFILGRMELHGDEFHDAVLKVKVNRIKGIKTYPEENAKKWNDPKPITALKNWGFFNSDDNTISDKVFLKHAEALLQLRTKNTEEVRFISETVETGKNNQQPLQQIYYGAPGTGKSHEINRLTEGEEVVRTIFHPDSDYSTFVGCYKPTMKVNIISKNGVETIEEQIVYRFVPQAFTKAYTAAWNTEDDVYLIIEEINRGNCAQIFGDLFQLLDRKDGVSEYPVDADTDLADYIRKELTDSQRDFPEGVKEGKKLVLPSNLYIWATMNTSDQSLFPIDSAFKRRWDWVYMPIDTKKEIWHIKVGDVLYSWTAFLEKINNEILTDETAEDKHLGFYFCKAENNEITQETFVGKVLFYLWNDVFKVYGIPSIIGSSKEWAYTKFYNTDGKVNEQKVKDLMAKLQIAPEESNGNAAEESSEQ